MKQPKSFGWRVVATFAAAALIHVALRVWWPGLPFWMVCLIPATGIVVYGLFDRVDGGNRRADMLGD